MSTGALISRWSPSRPRISSPRALAIGAGVLAGELVLAAGIVQSRLTPLVGAFLAGCAVALVLARPLFFASAGLASICFLFADARALLPVGPVPVHLSEAILAVLLVAAALRPARPSWGGFAGAALAAFFFALAVAVVAAVTAGRTDLRSALDFARPFVLLAYFYVIVRLVPDRRGANRMLAAAAGLGAVTGFVSALIAVAPQLGENLLGITGDPSETLGFIQRVRLPGLALAYMLFWLAVYRAVSEQGRARVNWTLAALGMALGLAVSLNRNMWVGLAVGFVVLVFAGSARLRRSVVIGLAAGAAGLALLLVVVPQERSRVVVEPLTERATSLLRPGEALQERSLEDRADETRRAWHAVLPHLGTGLGPAVPWGSSYKEETPTGQLLPVQQLFLHNQYLYLLVIGGIPALACFLALLGAGLKAAWRPASGDPNLLSCGVGLLMVAISATVMISLSVRNWTAAIGFVLGLIVVLADRRLTWDAAVTTGR